jgi:hypothetical protein
MKMRKLEEVLEGNMDDKKHEKRVGVREISEKIEKRNIHQIGKTRKLNSIKEKR